MEVPTNPTRQSTFVWICGSFFISANEIRVSGEVFLCTGTETHGGRGSAVFSTSSIRDLEIWSHLFYEGKE